MYHITLTNKETGDVIVDEDIKGIVGALGTGDGIRQLGIISGNAMDVGHVIMATLEVAKKTSLFSEEHEDREWLWRKVMMYFLLKEEQLLVQITVMLLVLQK